MKTDLPETYESVDAKELLYPTQILIKSTYLTIIRFLFVENNLFR